jgi:hypothetical protein
MDESTVEFPVGKRRSMSNSQHEACYALGHFSTPKMCGALQFLRPRRAGKHRILNILVPGYGDI